MTNLLEEVIQGPGTKSSKIRRLNEAGYKRSQIATALGIRYQFVRNVLVDDERVKSKLPPNITPDPAIEIFPAAESGVPISISVGAKGEVHLPQNWLAELGVDEKSPLVATFDGIEIRICALSESIRRAQELVRQIVPAGISLSDEIIADRRKEADTELEAADASEQ